MFLVEKLFYFDVIDPAGLTICLFRAAYMPTNIEVACIISGVDRTNFGRIIGSVPATKYAVLIQNACQRQDDRVIACPQHYQTKINHNYPVNNTFKHTTKCVID